MGKLTQVSGAVTRALEARLKIQNDAAYLGKRSKATDSDKLDGLDSTHFSRSNHTHTAGALGVYTIAQADAKFMQEHLVAAGTPNNITKSGAYRINPGATGFPAGDYSTLLHVKGSVSDTHFQLNAPYTSNRLFFRSYNNGGATGRGFNEIFHTAFLPTKTHVGLPLVNNWSASSDPNLNSTTTYATTAAVHATKVIADSKMTQATGDGRYLGKTAKAADADKLDGLNSSDFSRSTHTHTTLSTVTPSNWNATNLTNGFYQGENLPNAPQGGWVWAMNMHHTSGYGMQIAAGNGTRNYFMRSRNAAGEGVWDQLWHTGNLNPLAHDGKAVDSDKLDGLDSTQFLRSDADDSFSGDLVSTARNKGICGTYDSSKTDQIWSIGVAYKNDVNGLNFGNLYGLAYKHTNNGTGGTMAGGHQMVWCTGGTPKAALGEGGIWSSGYVNATTATIPTINTATINLTSGSTDSASIRTLISGTSTFFDFRLSDDIAGNDKYRWLFNATGDTTERTSMEMYVTNKGANQARLNLFGEMYLGDGSKRAFHEGHPPTKAEVGLPLVNNWSATGSVSDTSDAKYATAGAVQQTYARADSAWHLANGKMTQATGDVRYAYKDLQRSAYRDITVAGDANTFYPVIIGAMANDGFGMKRVSISRGYNWTAPAWNTSTHKGGCTCTLTWSGDGSWGGNTHNLLLEEYSNQYTTVLGGLHYTTSGIIVYLRGGGALYRINSPYGNSTPVTVALSGHTTASGSSFSPRTKAQADAENLNTVKYIVVRGGTQLFDTGDRVYSPNNQNISTSVSSTSATTYASSSAVKSAYDLANSKVSKAGDTMTGNLTINNNSPTIVLKDTDHKSAFLHTNSNQFYVLRSAGNNGTTWDSGPNGRHPMTLNLDNGNVYFSGQVFDSTQRVYSPNNLPNKIGTSISLTLGLSNEANFATTSGSSLFINYRNVGGSNLNRVIFGSGTGTPTRGDIELRDAYFDNGNICRKQHNSGYLVGSYNSVGENSTKTNPIYTIGSNYKPTDTALSNMYGIGYTHTNAAFIPANLKTGNWGMYVASDGDARVWLCGGTGQIKSTGEHYVGTNRVFHQGFLPPLSDLGGITKAQGDGYYLGKTSNAASSSYILAHDDRDVKPNTTGISDGVKGIKAFFVQSGTTGTGSNYTDLLVIDTYSDSSGGKPNALAFNKSTKAFYHLQPSFDGTTWDTASLVYTAAQPPSKTTVGLPLVNNWSATGSVTDTSDSKYATAGAVQQTYARADSAWNLANSKLSQPADHTTNATWYYPTWHNGSADLYTSKSKLTFRPSDGRFKAGTFETSNWFRSTGATGWYNETYGGGIHMSDSTWVRVYANKQFYVSSTSTAAIHTAGGVDAVGGVVYNAPRLTGSSIDFNNYIRTGCYNVYATGNMSNRPPSGFDYGTLQVIGSNSSSGQFVTQIFTERMGGKMAFRGRNDTGSAWQPWNTVVTSGQPNISSSVSSTSTTVYASSAAVKSAYDRGTAGINAANGKLARLEDSGHLVVPESKWFRAANTATGFLPYRNNNSSVGVSGWSFYEAWVNNYRGVTVNVSGDITAFSDQRVKSNIEVIPNALDKVEQLRGVTFTRTDLEGKRQTGLIAQELEKVLPEAVTTFRNEELDIDDFKSVNYGATVGLLVEAIKELRAEIKELKRG